MRPARQLPPWLTALALAAFPTAADDSTKHRPAEPFPAGNTSPAFPEKTPAAPATGEKDPATDGVEKNLPLGGSPPRLTPTPTLLPDEIPAPKGHPLTHPPTGAKPGPTAKKQDTAADLDVRIRYRKARNIAESDNAVRVAWEQTRYPKNDQQKRDTLKRYYELLFAKMVSVDRGIAKLVEERRKAEAASLTQTHIAPTIPIE